MEARLSFELGKEEHSMMLVRRKAVLNADVAKVAKIIQHDRVELVTGTDYTGIEQVSRVVAAQL